VQYELAGVLSNAFPCTVVEVKYKKVTAYEPPHPMERVGEMVGERVG
jgi:hypothetical protein